MRFFAKLKNRLFPYLFSAAHDAHARGWPVMRAMFVEFPDDPACRYLDRQYMLGPSLLVAPIFRQDNVAEYYLPEGKWTNLISGKVIDGGRWQSEKLSFMEMPVFVRQNTLLPMSSIDQQSQWKLKDELTLHLFNLADGADLSLHLASSDGQGTSDIVCQRRGSKIKLSSDGNAPNIRLICHGLRISRTLTNGKFISESSDGSIVAWSDTAKPITLSIEGDS